jgi:RNA polymerase sigma factor (sigma-70 family)
MSSSNGFAQILEDNILARARRGDMEAYADIYRLYGRACYSLALRLLINAAAAEDIVQEVFLKLMNMLHSFRGEAPFGAWLKRLTVNASIDFLRRERRLDVNGAETILAQQQASETDAEQLHDVHVLLARLTPRARAVLVLHELEGYTHKEMASLFGQTESYSKSLLARSLQRLNALVDAPTQTLGAEHV